MFFVITHNGIDALLNLQSGLLLQRCEIGKDEEIQLGLAIDNGDNKWHTPVDPATISRFENLVRKIKEENQ